MGEWEYLQEHDRSHITNFKRGIRFVYARAIATYRKQTKKDILEIREDAYWCNGYLDKTMNALHLKQGATYRDIDGFWDIFEKIKDKEIVAYARAVDISFDYFL